MNLSRLMMLSTLVVACAACVDGGEDDPGSAGAPAPGASSAPAPGPGHGAGDPPAPPPPPPPPPTACKTSPMVVAGTSASFLLRADCSVWSWGNQFFGKLGNGSEQDAPAAPAPIDALPDVVKLSAGWFHALAIGRDGRLFAWGNNVNDQAGLGSAVSTAARPQAVGGLPRPIQDVAGGARHSLAVDVDGAVWAWGSNQEGQLGVAGTALAAAPMRVKGPSGFPRVVAVAAGAVHSLALGDDGSVWAWGNNEFGQLGRGAGANAQRSSAEPVRVALNMPAGVSVRAIAAASGHPWSFTVTGGSSFAVLSDGRLMSWGDGLDGMLGRNLQWSPAPTEVGGLGGAATAVSGANDHVLVQLSNGQVRSFGSNVFSRLGNGTSGGSTFVPQVVQQAMIGFTQALSDVVSVAAGGKHSLAATKDGRVVCWGLNDSVIDENCGFFDAATDSYAAAMPVPLVRWR